MTTIQKKAVLAHKLETDDDVRSALEELRNNAKMEFSGLAQAALRSYAGSNGGQLPTDVLQILPLLASPADPSILQRYAMLQSGQLSDSDPDKYIIGENDAPVDDKFDTQMKFNLNLVWFEAYVKH